MPRVWKASAAILAGGRSSRFGSDKALASVRGRPLIARIAKQLRSRFGDVLVCCDEPEKYRWLGVPVVADPVSGYGPLMGIATALRNACYERVFVVACDIPLIDMSLVGRLVEGASRADCVVPVLDGAHPEPLLAVYCRGILPVVEELLAEGRRAVRTIYDRVAVEYLSEPGSDWYINLNTRADLAAFLRRGNGAQGG